MIVPALRHATLTVRTAFAGGVRSIRADKPTLEDVFLTLTGKKLRDGGET